MPRHRRGWHMGGGHGHHARHSPITVALLEPFLLMLLRQHPGHGYTLVAELQELGLSTVHPSVVYRILREMEGLGWVESNWDTGKTQGPPRRNYSLTPAGEEALQYWRTELEKTKEIIAHFIEGLSA